MGIKVSESRTFHLSVSMWKVGLLCSNAINSRNASLNATVQIFEVKFKWTGDVFHLFLFETITHEHTQTDKQSPWHMHRHSTNKKRGSPTAVQYFTMMEACYHFAYQDYSPLATHSQLPNDHLPLSKGARCNSFNTDSGTDHKRNGRRSFPLLFKHSQNLKFSHFNFSLICCTLSAENRLSAGHSHPLVWVLHFWLADRQILYENLLQLGQSVTVEIQTG